MMDRSFPILNVEKCITLMAYNSSCAQMEFQQIAHFPTCVDMMKPMALTVLHPNRYPTFSGPLQAQSDLPREHLV